MKNILIFCTYTFAIFLLACGAGISDFTREIQSKKYYFSQFSSDNRYIWKKVKMGGSYKEEIIISKKVIEYKHNAEYIVAVRQVSNDYECSDSSFASELLKVFDYWIIEIKTGLIHGPLSFNKYNDKIIELDISLYRKANLPSEEFLKNTQRIQILSNCGNPVKI